MKLSKREITLLVALGAVLLIIVYYRFIIVPQTESIQTFKAEREQKRSELQTFRADIASQKKLEVELLNLKDKMESEVQRYFLSLDQEEIILMLNEFLEGTNLKLSSVSFEEPRLEPVGSDEGESEQKSQEEADEEEKKESTDLEIHTVNLEYESDYYSLLDFLKNISNYHKKIMIKNININKDETAILKGNTVLEFYVIGNIIEGQESLYVWEPDQGSIYGDPFIEFNEYTLAKEAEKKSEESNKVEDSFSYMSSIKDYGAGTGSSGVGSGSSGGSSQISENIETKDLFTFEDIGKLLFVGNDKDIKGELSLNRIKKTQGLSSLNLKYDFVEERRYNAANVSFDNKLIINEQPNAISIDVNPIERSECRIGITIRDREGNYFKLPLKESLNWIGFETLTVDLPIDINYPATVEKIYIESYDHYKKLTGNILLDNMKLIYEK